MTNSSAWLSRAGLAVIAGMAAAASTPAQAQTQTQPPATAGTDQPTRRPQEANPDPIRAFDTDKDGVLNFAEVKSAAAARFDELNPDGDDALDPREAAPALTPELFRQADTQGRGTVNKAEYLALVERLCREANPDGDDTLDRAELATERGRLVLRLIGR